MGLFEGTMYEVSQEMLSAGYSQISLRNYTQNESYVNNDNEWKNDIVKYDTREYMDSLGNTASFTVRYREIADGVKDLKVCDCRVSNSYDYGRICGDYGIVPRVNNTIADKEMSTKKTWIIWGIPSLMAAVAILVAVE